MLRNWQNAEPEPILRAVMQIAGIEPTAREKLRQIIQRYLDGDVSAACPADVALRNTSCVALQRTATGLEPTTGGL